jgi:iron-sulfur cluster assembly accessory protein
MFKRMFSTINHPISITTNAWNKMIKISKTQKIDRFLFSATNGGCNGFNYKLNLLNDTDYKTIYTDLDKMKPTIIKRDNTELLIDPMSEFLLLGTTIDYINEDYSNGVFENKFIFIPNKTLATSCGCGVSFTPK